VTVELRRGRQEHQSEAPVIGEHDAGPVVGFENDVVVFAGAAACNIGSVHGKAARHSEVHDQRFTALKVDEEILRPPSQNLHLTAGKASRKFPRQRDTQVPAFGFNADQTMP
jgi:hypothetical protein